MKSMFFSPITIDDLVEAIASKLRMQIQQTGTLPEQINNKEAAGILGCKVSYLAQLRHREEIPYYKSGREVSYKRSEIEAYRDSKRIPTKSERVQMARNAQIRKNHD